MSIPSELLYTREHEWLRVAGGEATIGITDYAQKQLGDVVFVELPDVGASFDTGDPFGTVESVKAVSEVYMPVGGKVTTVNDALDGEPELINTDPYGDGWLITLTMTSAPAGLMSAAEYEAYIAESEH